MFGISNPQKLLQPWRNLTHFTEELFAMLTSKTPVEREGPVTIRVKPGQTALRLTRGEAPAEVPFRALQKNYSISDSSGRRADVTRRLESPRRASVAQPVDDGRRPVFQADGAVDFTGDQPVRFSKPPEIFDPTSKTYKPASIAGDTNWADPNVLTPPVNLFQIVFPGKVVDGKGNSYTVMLFPDGPDGEAGETVRVTIPTISADEQIDPGTWLFPVFRVSPADTDLYFAQPAVWME